MGKLLNKISCITMWLLLLGTVVSAHNIEDFYLRIPDKLLPACNSKIRLEMLEYFKAGRIDSVKNKLGGWTRVLQLDTVNNYLVQKSALNATLEMKLFKMQNGNPVIGVIQSVCAPVCHSSIIFYDTLWNKLPLKFMMPQAELWLDVAKCKAAGVDVVWVRKTLKTSFVTLHFDTATSGLTAENNTVDFLADEDRKVVAPLLQINPLRYSFEDGKWKLQQ